MEKIEQNIDYQFADKSLLATAFTHSSFANIHHTTSNERLEFLGDSVLNYVVTDFLFRNYSENEGTLSKIKANLVSADNLSVVIQNMNVLQFLKCENFEPKNSMNVECDLFEAIVGAIYLDRDFEQAKKFIYKWLNLSKNQVEIVMKSFVDYKTKLQELVQKNGKNTIEYILVEKTGKAHNPNFKIMLKINGNEICCYAGKTKRQAEMLCAKHAIENMS